MIRISPKELNFAASLAKIRRRPTQSTGPGSAPRYHQLSYAGHPFLTFATTDMRISLVSRLPVEEQGDPWECRVAIANFESFAAIAAGGKFTLNPTSSKCVRAEKCSPREIDPLRRSFLFAYPFHKQTAPTSYPCHELTETSERVVLDLALLRDSLAFTAPTCGEGDLESRLDNCTIKGDGTIIAHSNGVFFRATANPTSWDVNLYRPDACRLANWLALLREYSATKIEFFSGKNSQGRPCYQFQTPDHVHSFQVVAMPRSVPADIVRHVRDEPPVICGVVSAKDLLAIGGCFQAFENLPLKGRFTCEENQWKLHLATTGDAPEGHGSVFLENSQVTNFQVLSRQFLLSPVHLRIALARHRNKRLHLQYHSHPSTLTFIDNQPLPQLPNPPGHLSIVRIKLLQDATEVS